MASLKENNDEMRRLMELALAFGCIFTMFNIYWYCYDFFMPWFSHEFSDIFFDKLNKGFSLFASPWITLAIAMVGFGFFALTEKTLDIF